MRCGSIFQGKASTTSSPALLPVWILPTAGFQHVDMRAYDEPVSSGDLEAMAAVPLRVGPLGKVRRENPELHAEAERCLRAALGARGTRSRFAVVAATWIATAQA
jgi:hypothetical protein